MTLHEAYNIARGQDDVGVMHPTLSQPYTVRELTGDDVAFDAAVDDQWTVEPLCAGEAA